MKYASYIGRGGIAMFNGTVYQGGKLYYEIPVGILCLESYFPKMRGHLRNPHTYSFPTVMSVIKGLDIPKLLFNPAREMVQPLIDAAKQLEREGVKAITGSCGFMALFQKEIAEAVSVPVFMSSLLQLPLIRIMHGEKANIGILTASKNALTPRHLEACRVDWDSVTVEGMEGNLEFWETIIEGKRTDFNVPELEREIVGTALRFIETGKLDALLLECTDLAPFARQIQEQSHVPVYDINSLMMLVHSTVRWKI